MFLAGTLLEEGQVLQWGRMQVRFLALHGRDQLCLLLLCCEKPLQLTPQRSGTLGRELNHKLISIQLLPKAHLRHLIAEREIA